MPEGRTYEGNIGVRVDEDRVIIALFTSDGGTVELRLPPDIAWELGEALLGMVQLKVQA